MLSVLDEVEEVATGWNECGDLQLVEAVPGSAQALTIILLAFADVTLKIFAFLAYEA